MRTSVFVALPIAGLLLLPGVAHAQDTKDCPPGSWFCGDTKPPPPAAATPDNGLQPLPTEQTAPPPPHTQRPSTPPPPVVIYQPPPGTVIIAPREQPSEYTYVPRRPPPPVHGREWGLNLHLGGLMIGKGKDDDTGMALVGLGLRFRPIPQAALEADFDVAGGRDYNGYRRTESSLSVNGLVFFNPRDKAQVYFLAGFGFSGAKAIDDRSGGTDIEHDYGYFGVQTGLGLEFRLSRVVALNVDLRGFIRGRTDDARHSDPEFSDGQGHTTNASGGGLISGGMTFYW